MSEKIIRLAKAGGNLQPTTEVVAKAILQGVLYASYEAEGEGACCCEPNEKKRVFQFSFHDWSDDVERRKHKNLAFNPQMGYIFVKTYYIDKDGNKKRLMNTRYLDATPNAMADFIRSNGFPQSRIEMDM